MINEKFQNSFNLFVNNINTLKLNCKNENKSFGDPLNRVSDCIDFIFKKESIYNDDLNALATELKQMQEDCVRIKSEFNKDPIAMFLPSFIDVLLLEIQKEKEIKEEYYKKLIDTTLKAKIATAALNTKKLVTNTEKVKIFHSSFIAKAEDDINLFLSNHNVVITRVMQTSDKNSVCLTIFYKEN